MNSDIRSNLQMLGFTHLESEIYLFLLASGLSTGYAIAKGINKPAANVYKGLETLGHKGGVVCSLGNNKSYNAVHWQDLLDQYTKRFNDNIESLSKQLKVFEQPGIDEQVYQLSNQQQVIETSLKMINAARSIILADIEPDALSSFSDALVNAAERGVEVRVKLYEPAALKGVHVILRRHGEPIHEKSKDIAYSISCDGEQFVLAMLSSDKDRVIQAFHSHSALMNITIHTQILYGQILTDLKQFLKENDLTSAQAVLAQTEHLHPLSAENMVFERYKSRYQI